MEIGFCPSCMSMQCTVLVAKGCSIELQHFKSKFSVLIIKRYQRKRPLFFEFQKHISCNYKTNWLKGKTHRLHSDLTNVNKYSKIESQFIGDSYHKLMTLVSTVLEPNFPSWRPCSSWLGFHTSVLAPAVRETTAQHQKKSAAARWEF